MQQRLLIGSPRYSQKDPEMRFQIDTVNAGEDSYSSQVGAIVLPDWFGRGGTAVMQSADTQRYGQLLIQFDPQNRKFTVLVGDELTADNAPLAFKI